MTGKDVPLSTWPNAHQWRKPCGCTRFSTPAFAASLLHKARTYESHNGSPRSVQNKGRGAVIPSFRRASNHRSMASAALLHRHGSRWAAHRGSLRPTCCRRHGPARSGPGAPGDLSRRGRLRCRGPVTVRRLIATTAPECACPKRRKWRIRPRRAYPSGEMFADDTSNGCLELDCGGTVDAGDGSRRPAGGASR